MLLNWLVEGLKWKLLIDPIHQLKDREVRSSIALGLCSNIIAPNRIGELAARLNHLPSEKRGRGLFINFFAASAQLLTTLLMGLWGITYLAEELPYFGFIDEKLFLTVACCISFLLLWLYFRSRLIGRLFHYRNRKKKSTNVGAIEISLMARARTLLLSGFRYLIFSVQFYFLLCSLGAELPFFRATALLAVIFLLNSFIPSNWISDLIGRTSITFFLSQQLGFDAVAGMLAISGLWLINLFLPSLFSLSYLKEVNWMRLLRIS